MESDGLMTAFSRLLDAYDAVGHFRTQQSGAWWMGEDVFERLVAQGFFIAAGTSDTLVCHECDRHCQVQVRRPRRTNPPVFEFRCRPLGQLVDVSPEELLIWQWSPDAVARWLARELGVVGSIAPLAPGLFRLGERRVGRLRLEVHLAHGITAANTVGAGALAALPQRAVVFKGSVNTVLPMVGPDWTVVSVDQLLARSGDGVALDPEGVETALEFRPTAPPHPTLALPPGIAWTQVVMRVLDNTTIQVSIGKGQWLLKPETLGLMGKRGSRAMVRAEWRLLIEFADHCGELNRRQAPAESRVREKLSSLRACLCQTFGVTEDPFQPRREGGWVTRFSICWWDEKHLPRPTPPART